jgi:ankyrin repeat protein
MANDMVFEEAAKAVLTGDTSGLRTLLQMHPSLIGQRSSLPHHATLLHYIADNGVESLGSYPRNAVEVLDMLLGAGADVDATADFYGGGATTLGLVATSMHPAREGVQVPLLERLLAAGAQIDAPEAAGKRHRAVNGCLANGRPEAAVWLAEHGALLDLEASAGVGRLDIVESFFDRDGKLKDAEDWAQLGPALVWASEYGHLAVMNFLMDRGVDPGEAINGIYALDMAVCGGHLAAIRLLIQRGAPLESQNRYGGTPLGMAFYVLGQRDAVHTWPEPAVDELAVIEALVSAGASGVSEMLSGMADSPLRTAVGALLRRYGIEPA